ncbi:MAG TPA: hypothetical protein VKK31_01825 [Thermoanaerobaculia bacterium]|nr:hypothetical protein [Thermoanaerobaculia bacterium]
MTRPAKVLIVLALALLAVPVGATLLLAGSVVTQGLVTVKVNETQPGGTNVYVPVPAGLLYLGIDLLPLLDREGELARARQEMGDWAPLAAAALQSFEDCPDAVLVDIRDHGDTVKIVKEGRSIEIRVHDRNGDIHITLPAHLFTRVAHQFV